MAKRRYEILLPAEFNDGRPIVDACPRCLPDSLSEVINNFGAFTFRPMPPWEPGRTAAAGTKIGCTC